MKKNLVIGSGRGYNWYTWEPFVRSFVKNVQNADLVLFVDDLTDFTRQMLEKIGKEIQGGELKLEPFPEDLKEIVPVIGRWKMFLRYLENHGDKYEQVLCIDTRDAIFQSDIFKEFEGKENFLAYATQALTIAETLISNNLPQYYWIEKHFGKAEADKLADKKVACSGTIIGTIQEIEIFCEKIWEHKPANADWGSDESTLNYMVYNNLLPIKNLIEMNCISGAVLTSQWFHICNPVKLKDNCIILRGDGKVPAVVHTYDRNDFLLDMVNKIYRYPNYQLDEKSDDIKTEFEKMSYALRNDQVKTVIDFLASYISSKKDLSAFVDDLTENWHILSEKRPHGILADACNLILQSLIMNAVEGALYVNRGKAISECLRHCRKNNLTIVSGFETWLKDKIIEAVKWHISHENIPRYSECIRLMVHMNLTDNETFYFLIAEKFKSMGNGWEAGEYYDRALDYKCLQEDERKKISTAYHHKLWQVT